MGIQRVPTVPFAQISNAALRDQRLSFKARGILAMVLSHAGEWQASFDWLISKSDKDGATAIQSGLNELTALGYRKVTHTHLPSGQVRTVTEWFQEPVNRPPENPVPGLPDPRPTGESLEHNLLEHNEEPEHNGKRPDPADPAAETIGQHSNRIARQYADVVPLSNFPAIAGMARKAINAGYSDTEIVDALLRIADEGRSVTVESLRIEIEGRTPRTKMSGAEMYARASDTLATGTTIGGAMTALDAAEGVR